MRDLASLHWLIAIATPFNRGSAAIAENFIRAMLLAKNRTVECFNTFPDLEAFTVNRNEFVDKYKSMFVAPPVFSAKDPRDAFHSIQPGGSDPSTGSAAAAAAAATSQTLGGGV